MPATKEGTFTGGGIPVNDCYGNKTAAAGTPITRLVWPRADVLARISGFNYKAGATAHQLTFLNVIAKGVVTSDVAAAATAIPVDEIPTSPVDGLILAGNDWISVQFEDKSWAEMIVSSVSGQNVNVAALAKKILKNSTIFFHFAPADHADRAFTIDANEEYNVPFNEKAPVCSATGPNMPILTHVDNITNAGRLRRLGFIYDPNY